MGIVRVDTAFHTVFDGEKFSHLSDASGHLMTQDQWRELKKAMDELYEVNSDYAIRKYNEGAVERRMAETRKYVAENQQKKPTKPGVVYFLSYERHGIKIGYTRNLQGRLSQLRIASPFPLTLIGSIETDDPEGLERYAHQFFEAYKINSEWFSIDEIEIFDFINRYQK